MLSKQVIKASIDEVKAIMKVDICVMDMEGNKVASTFEESEEIRKNAVYAADSPADGQQMKEAHYFKVYDETEPVLILVAKAGPEDSYSVGKLAVSQLQHLIEAYRKKVDKNHFMQSLLLDNILQEEIYNRAKQLHINTEARRIVFIIETRHEQDQAVMETVRGLMSDPNKDFVTAVDERSILLVRELRKKESMEDMKQTADMLVDMINSEAMLNVRVGYGTIVENLTEVTASYREARMALEVGRIFYHELKSIGYRTLGIGRLIYQLPKELCESYLEEIFEGHDPGEIDEETLMTISKFFETNLNISETARQLYVHRNTLTYRLDKIERMTGLDIKTFEGAMTFKIALMVRGYLKDKAVERIRS